MCPLSWLVIVQLSPPPLKTWEIKGSCNPNSLIYCESMKVLHGKYLCDAGISGGFGAQLGCPHCQSLVAAARGRSKKGQVKSKLPLCWCPSQTPAVSSNRPGDAQHKFPHPAEWLLFCSVYKASCVAGNRSPCTVP